MRVYVAGVTRNKWNQQLQEIKETKGNHLTLNFSLSFFLLSRTISISNALGEYSADFLGP